MTEPLTAVLEELQRLKRTGVTSVSVSDEALAMLHRAFDAGAAPPSTASMPPAVSESPSPLPSSFAGSSGRAAASSFSQLVADLDKPGAPAAKPALKKEPKAEEAATGSSALPPPTVVELPQGTKRERWDWLRDRVLNCPVCKAHTHGDNKVVFGVGDIDASIFFCGEAPGGEEEVQGEPFVGPAGQLLNKMIGAMGLKREQVYIGNILNWRPEMEGRQSGRVVKQTGNRPPTPDEMRFGLPYLRAQIEVVQPKVIVALGSTAAEGLLGFGSFQTLGSIRGKWHTFNGVPLMVTYHPSYLLRNQTNRTKRIVWEDLMLVMEKAGVSITEKQRGFFLDK